MNRRCHARVEALEAIAPLAVMGPVGLFPPVASSVDLSVTLTTDRSTYPQGQPVRMTLTETNISRHDVSVEEGPSIDGFSVTRNRMTVWVSNPGPQPLYVLLRPLHPGASVTLSAVWDGKSDLPWGRETPLPTPSGPFVVHSAVPGAAPVTITILPKFIGKPHPG